MLKETGKRKFPAFHLDEVQEKKKIIYDDRNQNAQYLCRICIDWKEHEKAFWITRKLLYLGPGCGYKGIIVTIY